MKETAQLVMPAIRWDPDRGYDGAAEMIDRTLALGVGGYILFGGTVSAARALITDLRRRASMPLLIAADLERGAGQQFAGATALPPLAALASLTDIEVIRRAARVTAIEARAIGINWVLGPVCDLDIEPDNPIVGTRSLGADPLRVAEQAAEWIDACQAMAVLACAKHFPGHGRTKSDSHVELPVVDASAEALQGLDIVPFRGAIDAGVAAIMTCHVAYPALDPDRAPATLSRPILRTLLRSVLGYQGMVVTDAMIMDGLSHPRGETGAAVEAVASGCDILLYPRDVDGVISALEAAVRDGGLSGEHVQRSMIRRGRWAQWATPVGRADAPWATHATWAAGIADRVVNVTRGSVTAVTSPVELIVVDDDLGGPYPPPSRQPFQAALAEAGLDVHVVDAPSGRDAHVVIALFGETRGWKGRAGYARASLDAVRRACAAAPSAIVMQFGHPRLAADLPGSRVVSAWGGEALMQAAAARRLLRNDA